MSETTPPMMPRNGGLLVYMKTRPLDRASSIRMPRGTRNVAEFEARPMSESFRNRVVFIRHTATPSRTSVASQGCHVSGGP
jgi:hypothetical protein